MLLRVDFMLASKVNGAMKPGTSKHVLFFVGKIFIDQNSPPVPKAIKPYRTAVEILQSSAQEIDARAQQVIHDHYKWVSEWADTPRAAPHVFSDLLDMVPKESFQQGPADFEQRRESIDRAMISSSQFCVTHGGWCTLLKPVDFDLSGLPCEENSKANYKRKFLHGRFGDVYLVWCKYHRSMRTPLLGLENTPDPQSAEVYGTISSGLMLGS